MLRWFGGKNKRLREAPAAPEGGCGMGGAVDVLCKGHEAADTDSRNLTKCRRK